MTTLPPRARGILAAACVFALPLSAQFAEDPDPAKALAKAVKMAEASIDHFDDWAVVRGRRVVVTYGWKVGSSEQETEKNRVAATQRCERAAADISTVLDQIDAIIPRKGRPHLVPITRFYPSAEEFARAVGKNFLGKPDIDNAWRLALKGQFHSQGSYGLSNWYVRQSVVRGTPEWLVSGLPRHLVRTIREDPKRPDCETYYRAPTHSLEQLKRKRESYRLVDRLLADPSGTIDDASTQYLHDALFDFLERGPTMLKKKWRPEWSQILPKMGQAISDTKDGQKAVQVAFEGVDKKKFARQLKRWIAAAPKASRKPRWAR